MHHMYVRDSVLLSYDKNYHYTMKDNIFQCLWWNNHSHSKNKWTVCRCTLISQNKHAVCLTQTQIDNKMTPRWIVNWTHKKTTKWTQDICTCVHAIWRQEANIIAKASQTSKSENESRDNLGKERWAEIQATQTKMQVRPVAWSWYGMIKIISLRVWNKKNC